MNKIQFEDMLQENVIESMISFMEECEECDFTQTDVEECGKLISNYLEALAELINPNDDEIMEQVKNLVLALNELNESTDYALIETGEREAIWEIIQTSAVECGLKNVSDDITEEWREW